MMFTKGHTYSLQLKRHRANPVTYSHARYLGPDPGRDGVQVFWWEDQAIVLKVEEAVVTEATETSELTTGQPD